MSLRFAVFLAVLGVIPPLCKTCAGQSAYAPVVLQGTVIDTSGAAIVDASILLESDRSQAIFQTASDRSGQFSLSVPASGVYRATISSPGFRTGVLQNLQLSEGVVNLPDIALEVGVATDTVYVNEALTFAA